MVNDGRFWTLKRRFTVKLPFLLWVVEEGGPEGLLPPLMRMGHVTLLFKEGYPKELANWRSITVLSADYKILAKARTNRLSGVIGILVHPDQTGSVPGRSS